MKPLKLGAALLFCAFAISTYAQEILTPSIAAKTENGLFMDNGRYFVAGESGIQEIKSSNDSSSNCKKDNQSGLTACTIVGPTINGQQCFFSSMTTDDYYLYATCTVWKSGILTNFLDPDYAAILRILPGNSRADEVIVKELSQPVWYNGMTMLDDDSILMTKSVPAQGDINAAIVKLDITNQLTFDFNVSKWLSNSFFYFLPNGIQYDDGFVYFVGGNNLFRIEVLEGQKPGFTFLIFQAALNKMLDDITVVGDWIATTETGLINGVGINRIIMVHNTGMISPKRLETGNIQLSSLALDPGTLTYADELIATSYYQGGLYRFPMP